MTESQHPFPYHEAHSGELEFTGEWGIKVGPNPEPEPPEDFTLIIEFEMSDGSVRSLQTTYTDGLSARDMTLKLKRGTKDLGPILRTHFWFHEDSKQLHTICRRELSDEIEDDEPPAGPEIDIVEW